MEIFRNEQNRPAARGRGRPRNALPPKENLTAEDINKFFGNPIAQSSVGSVQ